jgi:hypothetical protein
VSESPHKIREQLLAQNEPTHEQRTQYEKETQAMLMKNEVGLWREKWGAGTFWVYAIIFMTAALWITGYRNPNRPEVIILGIAFMLLISGVAELIKHFINRSRVEVLKELKSMEMQLLDLKAQLSKQPDSSRKGDV